ncbi:hypothetical protein B484DRAFT_445190 [Ochromonadaceae sp. CCMP2298]|nr:hypothetical protein B484DRAFT_445190 [Ochromonadaceae sp. CCMP2298]
MLRKVILPAAEAHRMRMIAGEEEGLREVLSSQSSSGTGTAPCGAAVTASQTSGCSANSGHSLLGELLGTLEQEDEEEVEHGAENEEEQPRGEQWREILHPSFYQLRNTVASSNGSAAEAFERVLIASDGAQGQVEAALTEIAARIEKKKKKIDLLKYAGGCSMSQSLNDIGAMHRVYQTTFRSPSYRYSADYQDLPGKDVRALKIWLKKRLDPASFKTFWKCLMHAPDFLAKSFQPSLVKAAYKTAGIFPTDYKRVLSMNPFFRTLPTSDAQALIDHIPELGKIFHEDDMVHEVDFDKLLAKENGERLDNIPTKIKGKPLNDMVGCRQRCGKVNGPKFLAIYGARATENATKRAEKKQKTAATAAAVLATSAAKASAYSVSLGSSSGAAAPAASKKSKVGAASSSSSSSSAAAAPAATAAPSATAAASGAKKRKRVTYTDPPTTTAAATTTTTAATTTTNTGAATTTTTTGAATTTATATASTADASATTTAAVQPAKKKRKATQKKCSNTGCVTKLDAALVADEWTACDKGKCKLHFCCSTEQCEQSLALHIAVCGK